MQSYEAGEVNLGYDFDSYRKLYEYGKKSRITDHNAIGKYAEDIVANIKKNLSVHIDRIFRIADVGGGTGGIARELKRQFPDAEVYSYDMAEYATKYGNKNIKDVNFVNMVINENTQLSDEQFDLVLAYEFYPFTRTKEWTIHKKYLDMCIRNCNRGGYVVLGMPDTRGGVFYNIMTENENKVLEEYENMYQGKYNVEGYPQYLMVFKKP